jgi:hypothetical protein
MRDDLNRFLNLYQDAVSAKRYLLQAAPGSIGSASAVQTTPATVDPLQQFKPKDDSEYLSRIEGKTLVKSRRHERLVRQYGEWAEEAGYLPATPHPRDLVLHTGDGEWLVEGKIVYQGNATYAVRAALGQLYAYRHFHYPQDPPLGLIALFSEPIGSLYSEFLTSCGIVPVWRNRGKWTGTPEAVNAQLAEASD